MQTALQFREKFGALLSGHLTKRGLGLRELARAASLSHGLVSDVKSGRKSAGADLAVKLADALHLEGQERESFLLAAAGTRTKDKLMKLSQGVAPELVNHLPLVLAAARIHPASVDNCQRTGNDLTLTLDDGSTVKATTQLS